ncbi:amidohydrolase family protein [Mariniradius sediminis]|uniref:Amidohydrolase family protein n=1 Tax=Mariniradius sediminis TaxID=2909237 RepID=A0ABS9BV67_9BACT|nr:amidohydrolase family protein [Mariniradius sediminis]MCF1751501.1 amidohydrolase family protein [Mariniradius sediminis]
MLNAQFRKRVKLLVMAALILGLHDLAAQSDPKGERRVTGTYAIQNATVTTAPGKTLSKATILIKNGIIESVGTNISIPKDAQLILADSLYIYPGFIDGASSAGVGKPADAERPANMDPSKPTDEVAGITPWRNVLDYFDKNNSQIGDWRKNGVTIAQIVPEGGMLPGKSAIVTFGHSSSSNVIAAQVGMSARFRALGGGRGYGVYPGTPLGIMAKYRDVYKNAEISAKHNRLFASTSGLARPEINKTSEAMYPVLDKNIPMVFEASSDIEVRRVLSLQKELGFRVVLAGVTEVDNVISEIKAANAAVLLSMKLPEDKITKAKTEGLSEEMMQRTKRIQESYENMLKQAAKLEAAGIPFGFAGLGSKSGDMLKNLRIMAANGLSENGLVAALTTNPANILGIGKFAGTIEKGKLANLVIMTGPILSEDAQVKHVVADGYIFDNEVKPKKNGNDAKSNGNGTVSIEGVWDYVSDTPAGSSGGTMDIKRDGNGYKGTITYDSPSGGGKASSEMKNITVSGNTLSFSFGVAANGMSLDVEVSGEVNVSQFTGNLSLTDYGSFPLKATKKPNQSNF